ncbi:MAG: hypothetical protein HY776_08435 [Actinobacteria bacterium]|nr:hypothetical protein [Actinomycetota bacterium]
MEKVDYSYFSVPDLYSLLAENDFKVELFADSPTHSEGAKSKLVSLIKQIAVKFNLIPKTMKGKEKLKRLFFGKLQPLPPEIKDGMAEYSPPVSISHDCPNSQYKVLFAVARFEKQCE